MILEEVKGIAVVSDIEGIKGGISAESLPFMFRILSKAYYSRKLDSIVRELGSNCYDSHIEAGVTEPIIIEKRYDIENNNYNIVFKDVGIGMSPDRVYNIFNNWFTSTKRESNNYIGAFGLGSKSPFAYRDDFYITTVYNGLKYEYIYILTATLPDLISLNGYNEETVEVIDQEWVDGIVGGDTYEIKKLKIVKTPIGTPTTEHNGTEIIIPLLEPTDWVKFQTSIKKELCYFNDVYTIGFGLSNNYSIYRNNTFLYRPDASYSQELHIVLGQCCYPIDWNSINRQKVELPFGIIFNIGELQVNPNRESIMYDSTDDDFVAKLINSKIDAVLEEVNELLSKKGVKVTDDLDFYLANRDKKPSISFDAYTVYIPVKYVKDKSSVLTFSPLAHLPIKIPHNPFFYYKKIGYISGEVYEKYTNPDSIESRHNYIMLDSATNMYTNANLGYGDVAKRDNIKDNYNNICQALGLYVYDSNKYRGQYSISTFNKDMHYDYEKNEESKRYERKITTLGKPYIVREYIKVMDEYFKKKVKLYTSYTPTQDWIDAYKLSKKESSLAYQRKLNGEISIVNKNGYKETLKLLDLAKYTNVIYYVLESRKIEVHKEVSYYVDKLSNIASINNEFNKKSNRILRYWTKHYIFVGVAQSNLSTLKKLDNLVYLPDIKDYPLFDKYDQLKADYDYLQKTYLDLTDYRNFIKKSIFKTITEKRKSIECKFVDIDKYSIKEKLEPSKDVKDYCDNLTKELGKIEILNYIYANMPDKYLLPITTKLKTLILDNKYLGSTPVKPIKQKVIEQNILLL
jgi:hypothetical protein